MKVLIIANGPLEDVGVWQEEFDAADLTVAVDGGARSARALGVIPDLVVGDVDSMDPETAEWVRAQGVALQRHSPAKDETDLELALLVAAREGAEQIDVLGAIGGRPDQTMANLCLLAHPLLAGRRVRLLGGSYEILLLRGGERLTISGRTGDTLSLLPLSETARGIHTQGLRWALTGGTLHLGLARGISNEMTADKAQIRLGEGLLLAVHLLASSNDSGPSPPREGSRRPTCRPASGQSLPEKGEPR